MSEEDGGLPPDAPWWARWIVANWKDAWKWFTTWVFAALAIVPQLQEHTELLTGLLTPSQFNKLVSVLALLGFVLRLVNQQRGDK